MASFSTSDGLFPSGAPAGYTGSPADGKDCSDAACHGGTSAPVTNIITTNIPSQGYTPGTTYQITVTVPGAAGAGKGFEVSPQNASGTILGTLIPGNGSMLTSGNTGYITHSSAVTSSPAVWVFTWTAPVNGTGTVTFYGAFVAGFGNISHSSTTVNESNVGMRDLKSELSFLAFPNPVSSRLTLSYTLQQQTAIILSLADESGKTILPLINEIQNAGKITRSFDLTQSITPGIYFLTMNVSGSTKIVDKIIVN